METWRFHILFFIAATTVFWANAQTDTNQSQPMTTSSTEMPTSTEGISISMMMMMMNGSSSMNDTTSMLFDSGVMTGTTNDQPVMIGNSSQQPSLHIELSTSDSTTQTNQSDPVISTTTEAMTESPSTESTRVEWTTIMNTSPWVPGRFPPPKVGTENDGSKNTGNGASETGSTSMWNVYGNEDPNKDKYDMFMAHEPAKAEESTTSNGMETTMGSSKEMSMDNSAKSSQSKGNGAQLARVATSLVVILSMASLFLIRF